MRLIISPAKRMREDGDFLPARGMPAYLDRAKVLADYLRTLEYPALKRLLACNDQIARLNFRRYREMDLDRAVLPALLAYDGIQYQYMAPHLFTLAEYDYLQDHLRILSGLYGVLRPFDAVVPYRLEMGARLKTPFCKDLYGYWGGEICRAVTEDGRRAVLDLASGEYARAVRPWAAGVRCIRVVFGELEGERVVEKGVYVKMARGEMVRFLAQRGAEEPEEAQAFDRLGYRFDPARSGADTYVFLRPSKKRARGAD